METAKWKKPLIIWFNQHCANYGASEQVNNQLREEYIKLVNMQLNEFLQRVNIPLVVFQESKEKVLQDIYSQTGNQEKNENSLKIINDLYSTLQQNRFDTVMAWRKKVYQEKNELFEKTVAAKQKHSEDLDKNHSEDLSSNTFQNISTPRSRAAKPDQKANAQYIEGKDK